MSPGLSTIAAAVLLGLFAPVGQGAHIDGTIVVKRKLTKRKVTLEAGDYQRGAAVELDRESAPDVLAFEKSHVAIYLEGPLAARPQTRPGQSELPTMEQKNRGFVPDLLVVPVGSAVSFPNLDPIFHNVFSLSKPKSFDLGNYSVHQTRVVTFDKPGIVMVNCHLHPNMSATIVISPTGWATRADGDGHFAFQDLPPGRYTVVAWHKAAGFFRHEIEVTAERDARVEFLIPLPAVGAEPVRISSHAGPPEAAAGHPAGHSAGDR